MSVLSIISYRIKNLRNRGHNFTPHANMLPIKHADTKCHYIEQGLIDGLVQDCSNSIANALELLQSCTKPSRCGVP